MSKSWYDKFVACEFTIWDGDTPVSAIFQGVYANSESKSGYPRQYVFDAVDGPQYILDYKEARCVMGAMIEKYNK